MEDSKNIVAAPEPGVLTRRDLVKATAAGAAALGAGGLGFPAVVSGAEPIAAAPLPYAETALAPYISSETLSFHYGKHHVGYATKLNELIKGTPFVDQKLEAIVKATAGRAERAPIFNAAAQVWNHGFYWTSLSPKGGGKPKGKLLEMIEASYRTFDLFKAELQKAAVGQFGSGWAWVVLEKGAVKVVATSNAETPITKGQVPLLTIDVWEHAYYIDYRNKRPDYVTAVLDHLLDWNFAAENLKKA